ncbi:hypothetical protein JTB14_004625 [Gonioctena quinquepunctata]|nr:hypothetical protein JTB14_004625 [Gonioctena quinquepunctata]
MDMLRPTIMHYQLVVWSTGTETREFSSNKSRHRGRYHARGQTLDEHEDFYQKWQHRKWNFKPGENKWNTVDSSGFKKKKKKRNQLADRNTRDTLEVRKVDDVDVNNAHSTNLNVQQKTSSSATHEAEIAPKTHNISGRNEPIIGKMANCTTKALEESCSLHVYKLKPSATSGRHFS